MRTSLKLALPWIAAALVTAFGCQNTAEGLKRDAQINGQKAAEQTQTIEKSAEAAGRDVSAAAALTPAIKLALTADKRLNDPKNLIDVTTTAEKVTLSGHVTSEDLKSLAGELAQGVLRDKSAKQTFENDLQIRQ